jgi:hypothetical protein
VTGIFIYYYTLNKVDRRTHLKIGWIFAVTSWITMVIITGILSFMLSPGRWPETGGFFDGFFNQTYWPQLILRTTVMFAISATYAVAVATRLTNDETKRLVIKTASQWGFAGLLIASGALFWYLQALPEASRGLMGMIVPQGLKTGILAAWGAMLAYFLFSRVKPLSVKLVPAIAAIVVLFIGIWSAERTREMIRKPYVISSYLYSNQVIGKGIAPKGVQAEIERINNEGILRVSPFVPDGLRDFTGGNRLQAGRMIALIECSACHVLDHTGLRPLPQMVKKLNLTDAEVAGNILTALGGFPYMPPFTGTEAEKAALAAFLVSLNK